ncbi:DUF3757 domain-containing protein [Pseudomonas tremae]|uniref:DUF3757 domain-containing protein n=1 Tax=Pseudomonas tremae TaxID=200454 RepID=UPI001F396E60|nr:DUF3757 domain-containing protein [Pseudomonas tremae]MCF5803487.1 DUF3757 domain-containing protein [Pseudomonas tremae]MCF5807589.1 DUF3757 domain-containing protein [Pseudomonas tremae]
MKACSKKSVGIVALALLMGKVYAAPTPAACPDVSVIKQHQEGQGFVYTAPAPNNQQWRGENPRGDAKDINSIAFKTAAIRNRSAITGNAFVACDYEGNSSAGIRMSLETLKVATPVGKAWNGLSCSESNPSLCTFEY